MPRLTLRSLPVFLVFTVLLAGPARAQCEFDGTVPGTGPTVTTVAVRGVATFYVDDRDFFDLDGDGVAGGLWIYMESNEVEGLQRGGRNAVFGTVEGAVCAIGGIAPIRVEQQYPNPTGTPIPIVDDGRGGSPGNGAGDGRTDITLFPNGFGPGWCWHEPSSWDDPCADWQQPAEATEPDTLLF